MKNKKLQKKIIIPLICSIILIIVVGVFVAFYYFSNGFTSSLSDFLVQNSNGKIILNNSLQVVNFGEINEFKLVGLTPNSIYEVEIFSRNNFYYYVDDENKEFSKIDYDLSSFFDLNVNEDTFTIFPNYTAFDLLNFIEDKKVTIDDSVAINDYYFTVVINSLNSSSSFGFCYDKPVCVITDVSEVLF